MYLSKNNQEAASQSVTLEALFQAYFDCRHNKRYTINALAFEADYESNLVSLCEELNDGRYTPGRSIAFVIEKPVKREIFAADFRDRVVHHWLINQLNPLFERAFIYDSYASRKGRGAHLGIRRADHFIRQCSENYTTDCYILKLDIMGFFMSINRCILLRNLNAFIEQNYLYPNKAIVLDIANKIIMNDPTKNCFIKGARCHWVGFPPHKSLFHGAPDCGLPIGNLTSQVFANFYMNAFDHFVKHTHGIRYYGRYVDDFLLVHHDRDYLKSLIPVLADFLASELALTLHPKKMHLQHYSQGVHYLGVVIKPHRIYIGKRTKGNFYDAIVHHNERARAGKPTREEQAAFLCSMNSYLGILQHYHTYRLRKRLLAKHLSIWWWNLVYLSSTAVKLSPKIKVVR